MIRGKSPSLSLLFVASSVMFLTACHREESSKERWPGEWQGGSNEEISATLAANNVFYCNDYKYKVPANSSEAHLVRCTPDFHEWSTYMVWTQLNKVMGPYKTDPVMD